MLPGSAGLGDPETDAIDRWFEDLQHYEQTLEEMAAASLDQNFKEELSAIEQWFRVLSEAERTAALYSLLQSSTQVQIRFFITVLQQMARCDPSNAALFSPSNPQQVSMKLKWKRSLHPWASNHLPRLSLGNLRDSLSAQAQPTTLATISLQLLL